MPSAIVGSCIILLDAHTHEPLQQLGPFRPHTDSAVIRNFIEYGLELHQQFFRWRADLDGGAANFPNCLAIGRRDYPGGLLLMNYGADAVLIPIGDRPGTAIFAGHYFFTRVLGSDSLATLCGFDTVRLGYAWRKSFICKELGRIFCTVSYRDFVARQLSRRAGGSGHLILVRTDDFVALT